MESSAPTQKQKALSKPKADVSSNVNPANLTVKCLVVAFSVMALTLTTVILSTKDQQNPVSEVAVEADSVHIGDAAVGDEEATTVKPSKKPVSSSTPDTVPVIWGETPDAAPKYPGEVSLPLLPILPSLPPENKPQPVPEPPEVPDLMAESPTTDPDGTDGSTPPPSPEPPTEPAPEESYSLEFTSEPVNHVAGAARTRLTVQLQDGEGNPFVAPAEGVVLSISTEHPESDFALTPSGNALVGDSSGAVTVAVPEGSSTFDFYFSSTVSTGAEATSIAVSSGDTSAHQWAIVSSGKVTNLEFHTQPSDIASGGVIPTFAVRGFDAYGNPGDGEENEEGQYRVVIEKAHPAEGASKYPELNGPVVGIFHDGGVIFDGISVYAADDGSNNVKGTYVLKAVSLETGVSALSSEFTVS